MYKAVNTVEPSLIRTEADELTYAMHIIIRYEMEKAFINDEITVDEAPEVWNEKYEKYLAYVQRTTVAAYFKIHTGLVAW